MVESRQKYLKTESIEMWIEDGIFFGKYAQGVIIDKKIAEEVMRLREELCEYMPYLTFWDCRGVRYWTKDARAMQSTPENYRLMKAGACLYKESHVANVVINFFMKLNPPSIPSKFFVSQIRAIAWLKSLDL